MQAVCDLLPGCGDHGGVRCGMEERDLMKGNEALGEAAIRSGCRYYFGYPITPQSELPEYLARHLPEASVLKTIPQTEAGPFAGS